MSTITCTWLDYADFHTLTSGSHMYGFISIPAATTAVSYVVSIVNTLTHLIHIYSCIPYLHTLDTTVAIYYIACKITFMHNMHHYGALYI